MRRLSVLVALIIAVTLPLSGSVPPDTNGLVIESQRLTAWYIADASQRFGWELAIHGDLAVVGAPYGPVGAGPVPQGAVYVVTQNSGTWNQAQRITSGDAGAAADDRYGYSVATDGQTLVVGAPGMNGAEGAVFVYVYDTDRWVQQAKLLAADKTAGWQFGNGVAVDGDLIVVGSPFADAGGKDEVGAAYVFSRTGTTWTQRAKLSPNAADAGDNFGMRIRLSGTSFISGSGIHDVAGNADQGQVWIYAPVEGSLDNWTEQGALIADDGAAGDQFGGGPVGGAFDIHGDTAVVGAYNASGSGRVYIFTRNGTSWQAPTILAPGGETDDFGWNVAIDGSTIVAATSNDALLYSWDGSSWNKTSWLRPQNDEFPFGTGLGISGTTVMGGWASWYSNRGAVFVFKTGFTITGIDPTAGPAAGGTPVTITGTNLPDNPLVEFGGTPATNVDRENATTIWAWTPAHDAGTVDVSVSGGGYSAVLSDGFTYVAPPAVNAVTPSFGPVAGGTTVTITGAGFAETPTVTFEGQVAADVTFVDEHTLTATTPAHTAGPVDVVVTNLDDQSGTLENGFEFGDADLALLTVTGLPKAGAGFPYVVTDKVKNLGPGPAPATRTSFYLSADPVLNEAVTDRLIGERMVPALAKNQVSRAATTVTIPADVAPGSYYLLAVADGPEQVAETRETNNVKARRLDIGCNLLVQVLTAPRSAAAGAEVRITDSVKNAGPGKAPATMARLVLSTNATFGDGDDVVLRDRAIGSLDALKQSKLAALVTLPGGLAPGTYYLIAAADVNGEAVETAEGDNTRVRAITIR